MGHVRTRKEIVEERSKSCRHWNPGNEKEGYRYLRVKGRKFLKSGKGRQVKEREGECREGATREVEGQRRRFETGEKGREVEVRVLEVDLKWK